MAIISPARMASAFEAGWFFNENQQLRYQFRQSGKPAARPDGSSLANGDIWVEPNGIGTTTWFWSSNINGGRWARPVDPPFLMNPNALPSLESSAGTVSDTGFYVDSGYDIFFRKVSVWVEIASAGGADSWIIFIQARTREASSPYYGVGPQITVNSTTPQEIVLAENIFSDSSFVVGRIIYIRNNNPGPIRATPLWDLLLVKK